MISVRHTRQAQEDILEIAEYIAQDNLTAALGMIDWFQHVCELISAAPRMGRRRSDLGPGLRCVPVGAYLVFYRGRRDEVQIVRVLHGARDVDAIFRSNPAG